MIFRLEVVVTLFVMIIIFLLSAQMKLIEISDFISLRSLFILVTYILELTIILSILLVFIKMMICFLEGPFIVMLSLDLLF